MQPPLETFEIEDVRVLEVLNNPVRLRLLRHLSEPSTVRQLAERLEVPVTRLYYHLNLLEDVGVIEVIETRKSGAMLQRVYRTVATDFAPVTGLLDMSTDKERVVRAAVGMVLDGARLDATAGLLDRFGASHHAEADDATALGRAVVPMTRAGAVKIVEKISEIVEEMQLLEEEEGEEYAFSFVFFPMVGPVRGDGS